VAGAAASSGISQVRTASLLPRQADALSRMLGEIRSACQLMQSPFPRGIQTVHLVSNSKEGAASVIATASQSAASFIRFGYPVAEGRSTVRISEEGN
jgi:hypothetical protein